MNRPSDPLSRTLTESLELACHTVLHARGVYPPSVFSSTTYLGVGIRVAREEGIRSYIRDTLATFTPSVLAGCADSLVLTIIDEAAVGFSPGTAGSGGSGGTVTNGVLEVRRREEPNVGRVVYGTLLTPSPRLIAAVRL